MMDQDVISSPVMRCKTEASEPITVPITTSLLALHATNENTLSKLRTEGVSS